jgi:hypothetical protein
MPRRLACLCPRCFPLLLLSPPFPLAASAATAAPPFFPLEAMRQASTWRLTESRSRGAEEEEAEDEAKSARARPQTGQRGRASAPPLLAVAAGGGAPGAGSAACSSPPSRGRFLVPPAPPMPPPAAPSWPKRASTTCGGSSARARALPVGDAGDGSESGSSVAPRAAAFPKPLLLSP